MDCPYHEFHARGCKHKVGCWFRHRDLRTADRSLCPDWTARSGGVSRPTCPRGASCLFTHPNLKVLDLYDCASYLEEGSAACNADKCWLRHSPAVADAVRRGTAEVCGDWMKGGCRVGVACPYVHPTGTGRCQGRMPATMTLYGFDFLLRLPGGVVVSASTRPPPTSSSSWVLPLPPPPPPPLGDDDGGGGGDDDDAELLFLESPAAKGRDKKKHKHTGREWEL